MDKLDNMHKKAIYNREYNKKAYAQLNCRIKKSDKEYITNYCNNHHNISLAKFIVSACKYCIDNNINLTGTDSGQEDN